MEQLRAHLPVKAGLLDRPRVNALLEEGLRYGLVTVTAGPGYGKTYAVASFMKKATGRLAWMRFSRTDNLPALFWRGLVQAMEFELPLLAGRLTLLGFPDNMAKLDAFLHIFAEAIYQGAHISLVIDDFNLVQKEEIRHFFEYLVEAGLENFTMVLLSSTKNEMDVVGLRSSGGVMRLTGEELRFTPEETEALMKANGLTLSRAVLRRIDSDVEGWPLALYLMVQRLIKNPDVYPGLRDMSLGVVYQLFEKDFFCCYSPEVQTILMKLSLLPSFSADFIRRLGVDDPEDCLTCLHANMFVAYEPINGPYTFQHMYRSFLLHKQARLTQPERDHTLETAGDYFMSTGQTLEAVDCYEQCQRWEKMLRAIIVFSNTRMGLSAGHADYLLDKLRVLPKELQEENPLVDLIRVFLFFSLVRIDDAYERLVDMERYLLPREDEESRGILGEVYYFLGSVMMIRNRECFVEYFKKSCQLIPYGSRLRPKNMLSVENNSNFTMESHTPGAMERMEKAVHEGVPYMVQAGNGSARGMQYLFSGEAGYLTEDYVKMAEMTNTAIQEARENDQHDIICNAWGVKAKTACIRGDLGEMRTNIFRIRDYINDGQYVNLFDSRDYYLSWFYLKMGDLDKVSPWTCAPEEHNPGQPPITFGRDRVLNAEYQLTRRNYRGVLPLLERLEELSFRRGLWSDRLTIYIMRAIAQERLGNLPKSEEAFGQAYDMAYHNGIITPFIEQAEGVLRLVDAFSHTGRFDPRWLDSVRSRGAAYLKALARMRKDYAGKSSAPALSIPLSPREMSVLEHLSRGMTREEIADACIISVNTVKSTIRSIYNKLGAVNRADAIRIAIAAGLQTEERS